MIRRDITRHLESLFRQYPVVTVTGPRQSGKTTLCKDSFPGLKYVNLEAPDDREFAESDPRGFLAQLGDGAIIDEVQRVPTLLSYIQVTVDAKGSNSLFILTGSAQFQLSNEISQSLAGRTALLRLLPLSLSERQQAGASDAVDDILYAGFYPRIIAEPLNPTQALADYFETYVERDVRQSGEIRNLPNFRRFVRLCAGRVGQLVNFNGLGGDAGVSHTTARNWLSALEFGYILFQLPPHFANVRKRLVKSPKIYFYDVGLAAYLIGIENAGQLATHPLRGALFENAVVVEALKHRLNRGAQPHLSFFRDAKGLECDLLYPTGQEFAAFEVKSGATISSGFFGPLHRVAELVPNVTSKFVVYGGTERQTRSDSTVIPLANLGGTLERLEVDRDISAFVDEHKGLAPDASDIRALDLAYDRFIRPVLDELETVRQTWSGFFAEDLRSSSVQIDDNRSSSSNDLLEAVHWAQTKSQYIVVDGLKLSRERTLELVRTYVFQRYTGRGHGGFTVNFSINWKLDGEKLSRYAIINDCPIPELDTSVDYQQLGTQPVDVDQAAADASRHIKEQIVERSTGSRQ